MKKRSCVFLFFFLLASCAPIPQAINTPDLTPSVIKIVTSPIPTTAPDPTTDPMEDPDGDGYPSSHEEVWGTDPNIHTTFDDLKNLPGVITGIFHTREPYDIADMNLTAYQQIRVIEEVEILDEDNSWNNVGPHRTLTAEFILFPYVTETINEYTKTLTLPYQYPAALSEYVSPSFISDTSPEEKEMMQAVSTRSKTLFDLGENIISWNWYDLENDFSWGDDEGQEFRSNIKTSEMMAERKIGSCMIFATKMTSDFREARIPTGVAFSYGVAEVDLDTHNNDLEISNIRTNFHPQNAVWTPKYGWVVFQYLKGFKDTREAPYYVGLIFTDIAADWNDLSTDMLFASEHGDGYQWFYYSEDLQAPDELLPYLQPVYE